MADDLSRTRDNVIAFPVRDTPPEDVTVEDEPDDEPEDGWSFADLEGFTLAVTCDECRSIDGTHHSGCPLVAEEDPDEITEAGGRWVWQPTGEPPHDEPPVGMIGQRIVTMCRWTHRHLMEGMPIPQPCCYSTLVTTKRLPGPVRTERSWLTAEELDPS